jgi:hypothetical protein
MNDERGSWYLLTGIILGIGLGLLYSWVISPAEYIDTPPWSLREDFKDQYRAAIAASYASTGNLQRAKARLELLKDEDSSLALVVQAQRYLAGGNDYEDAQSLAILASALGQAPTPLPTQPENTPTEVSTFTPEVSDSPTPSPSQTPTDTAVLLETDLLTPTKAISATQVGTPGLTLTPTISRTPSPTLPPTKTNTPTPSRTPTATLAPPFVLDNQINVCNPMIGEPQIQVFLSNAAGVGIPGVEIVVIWEGGEDHFYSGLKPDIDLGYADFVMIPEVIYSLKVGNGGQQIAGLVAPPCADVNGDPYWGSIRLIFSHP